ncbi:MAG TPA: hypothetical protein VGC54_04220 [Planctomycetota bacterium]
MRPLHRIQRSRAGLTITEGAWAMLFAAGILAVILGTLASETSRGRARRTRDGLQYLARLLDREFETVDARNLPYPLVGPGWLPAGLEPGEVALLRDWLPDDAFLPTDGWGQAYVLRLEESAAVLAPVLFSAAGEADLPAFLDPAEAPDRREDLRLSWPR